jgi:hypothetical protein
MKALGLGRLRELEAKPPLQFYQWEKSDDMILVGRPVFHRPRPFAWCKTGGPTALIRE